MMNNQKIRVMLLSALFLGALTSVSSAAPKKKGPNVLSASCSMPAQLTLGQTYWGKVTGLPTGEPLNCFVTYGDGTGWAYPHGMAEPDGSINLGGWPASIPGVTTFKITGPTTNNTKVYAECSVNVVAQ